MLYILFILQIFREKEDFRCADYYGIDGNKCRKCAIPNCNYCFEDYTKCSKCVGPYFFDEELQECVRSDPNCYSSLDKTLCFECTEGYGRGYKEDECVKCTSIGCKDCNYFYHSCDECKASYGLQYDDSGTVKLYECRPCKEGCENCKYYGDKYFCIDCYTDYQMVGNECVRCPKYCSKCGKNQEICEMCRDGAGFIVSEGIIPFKCEPCIDPNCMTCHDNYMICNTCKDSFGLIQSTKRCVPCPENCLNCKDNTCTKCKSGYKNKNGKCIPACTDHCQECINSNDCSKCEPGYKIASENGKKVCLACPDKCLVCDGTKMSCEKCIDGYGLHIDSSYDINDGFVGKCQKCLDENCKTCDYDYMCETCKDGYYVSYDYGSDGFFRKCLPCQENCKKCSHYGKMCLECNDDYVFEPLEDGNYSSNCIPVRTNCTNYLCIECSDSPGVCNKCYPSAILDVKRRCRAPLSTIQRPAYKSVTTELSDINLIGKKLELNVNDFSKGSESDVLVFVLYFKNAEIIINNPDKRKIAFMPRMVNSELTFKIKEGSYEYFDINCTDMNYDLKVQLDPNTKASFLYVKKNLHIYSTNEKEKIEINEIEPLSEQIEINIYSESVVKKINFYENERIIFRTQSEEFNIQDINVNQGATALIENVKITGKITFGLSSNLTMSGTVDISKAEIHLPYNKKYLQALYDFAPIVGLITSKPKKVKVLNNDPNKRLLDDSESSNVDVKERYMIARSLYEFDCKKWESKVSVEKGLPIKRTNCGTETYENGRKMYVLYLEEGKKKWNMTLVYCIAGGVVLLICIIVSIVATVLCRRKREKEQHHSEREDSDDEAPQYI